MPDTRAIRRAALAAAAAIVLAACGSIPADRSERARGPASTPDQAAANAAARTATPGPALRESHRGLEVRVWLAENDAELSGVIAELPPADTTNAELWAGSGLALHRVPIAQLDAIRARLVRDAVRQSRWIGQPPDSIRLIQGPLVARADAVRVGGGFTPVDRGRAELHARAWTLPHRVDSSSGRGIETALAVELTIAHRPDAPPDPFALAVQAPNPPRILLTEALRLAADEAVLLLAFDPDAATAAPRLDRAGSTIRVPPSRPVSGPATPRPAANQTTADDGAPEARPTNPTNPTSPTATAGPNASPTATLPEPQRPPTLGELLIPDLPGPLRGSTRRPILVFVPRLPGQSPANATPAPDAG